MFKNIRNPLITVLILINVCSATSGPILADDAKIPIPIVYKPCLDLLVTLQDPKLTYNQASPLIEEQTDLLMELYQQDDSPNFMYVWAYSQTLINERERIDALWKEESRKPEGDRCADYSYLRATLYILNVVKGDVLMSQKYNQPEILSCLSFGITQYFELFPKSDSYELPKIISLATHKLFFMLYISVLMKEIPAMIGKYIHPDGIRLDRDGDKPFIEVFDREQRLSPDILCGSKIFDHFNAMKPYFQYIKDDGTAIEEEAHGGAGRA